ncbi:hypothetical protein [Microvirga solisilvae]|uniref:hypothetical protein n=1 Tax=Microvirga solisilvae TaxID=2919498 RepID=UPI001FAF18A9|nr:hypothetical protein [Microvirga solisilvae]
MSARLSILRLGALLLGLAILPAAAADRAPLTPQVENTFVAFTEWVYDVKLSNAEKEQVLAVFRNEWLGSDETTYRNAKNTIDMYERVKRMSKGEAVSMRNQYFSRFWPLMDANRQFPDVNAVMTAYLRQHRMLAKGHPPLSEEIADAKARYVQFTLDEGSGGVVRLDLDALKKQLAESYPSLSAEEQKATVHAMGQWAEIQYGWPNMSESERNNHRRGWRAQAEKLYPDAVAQMPPLSNSKQASSSGSGERSMMDIFNKYQEDVKKVDEKKAAEIEAALRSVPEPTPEPSTGNPDLDKYRAAQRKVMMDQMKTQMISNMLASQHQARMGIISNMPGAPQYKWVWTYR